MFDIQEELKKLPQKPGIYIMKDKTDEIIYVGKAKNLKNRVPSYFRPSNKTPKNLSMVPQIKEFEYIVTDNEVEALILECNLIKKHKPKYNVMLKDSKTYPYIKVTTNEPFPKIFMTRTHAKDKAKYFGPYTNVDAVKETLSLIQKIWQLKSCNRVLPRDIGKARPCLNFHIGKCRAPCNSLISKEEYNKGVEEVISFLNGKFENILKQYEEKMLILSENLEFEKAAEIRDKIAAVKKLNEKQKINNGYDDQDVIAFSRAHDEALVQVFFVRGGNLTGREHFMLKGVLSIDPEDVMTEFIKQFYGETTFIPKELVLQTEINDKETITSWLSAIKGSNVNIIVPQKGEKLKLVQMAAQNAILMFQQFGEAIKREEKRTIGALAEISNALSVDLALTRIEAYDISNIQGFESVGSMVVFENGKPKRSDYRKFKIKGILGPNDYASMEEVIRRRFLRYEKELESPNEKKFSVLPDILFIDGGKGQVHSACKVLQQLNLNIPVCGMIKDDKHRTRGIMFNDDEILLPFTSEGFKLLTRIQDEVHRFAIEYHRKLRAKAQVHSVLDEISGIGNTRRKALMNKYGSIEKIRLATIEELAKVETMNIKSAESVYNFFNNHT